MRNIFEGLTTEESISLAMNIPGLTWKERSALLDKAQGKGDKRLIKRQQRYKAITEYLDKHGEISFETIQKITGLQEKSCYYFITELKKNKIIQRTKRIDGYTKYTTGE